MMVFDQDREEVGLSRCYCFLDGQRGTAVQILQGLEINRDYR